MAPKAPKRVYCEAESRRGGPDILLICSKEKGHDAERNDPDTRVHYDATAREHFGYPGHLRLAIEIPGVPDISVCETLPDAYGAMDEAARRNYRHNREEAMQTFMNVYSEYVETPMPEEN
jgi:hypothetical protein